MLILLGPIWKETTGQIMQYIYMYVNYIYIYIKSLFYCVILHI